MKMAPLENTRAARRLAKASNRGQRRIVEKNEEKYKLVRFVERKKVERKLKKCRSKLATLLSGGPASEEDEDALRAKLARLEDDKNYIVHFPLQFPYLSLFIKEPSEETVARREQMRQHVRDAVIEKRKRIAERMERKNQGNEDFFEGDDEPKKEIQPVKVKEGESRDHRRWRLRMERKALAAANVTTSPRDDSQQQDVEAKAKIKKAKARQDKSDDSVQPKEETVAHQGKRKREGQGASVAKKARKENVNLLLSQDVNQDSAIEVSSKEARGEKPRESSSAREEVPTGVPSKKSRKHKPIEVSSKNTKDDKPLEASNRKTSVDKPIEALSTRDEVPVPAGAPSKKSRKHKPIEVSSKNSMDDKPLEASNRKTSDAQPIEDLSTRDEVPLEVPSKKSRKSKQTEVLSRKTPGDNAMEASSTRDETVGAPEHQSRDAALEASKGDRKEKSVRKKAVPDEDPTHPAWLAAQTVQRRGCIVEGISNQRVVFDEDSD